MPTKTKLLSTITLLFICFGGLLFYFDTLQGKSVSGGASQPVALWSLLVLALLLSATLYFINNRFGKSIEELETSNRQLKETDRALQEVQSDFNETLERRTFEISVINASLNREIAERMQAEAESKNLQRRLELILNSAGEGIFGLDAQGRVTFTNKAAAKMVGWSPEELVGKSQHRIIHHTRQDGSRYAEEDCPIYMAYKDGRVHSSSGEIFWTKDGTSFPIDYVSTPLKENNKLVGAVVIFSDITQRLASEANGKKLQHRMELILNSVGEGIFGLNTEGNVTFTNKAASLMLGWNPEELVGKSHHNLIHHTHTDGTPYTIEQCPIHKAYKDGKVHFSSDDVFWSKDGTSFPVEYISTPIREEGQLTGAVVVFRDLNIFN
ncbi:MAG: PAS domain-containing protein [Desulfobulbaceae bacterium]|nr:PAS domain-containing protein [Desulfobulbaceae bacterium]